MLQVLQDMLQLLKESVSSKHAERLEQIVIVLIAIEIGLFSLLFFMSPVLMKTLCSPGHHYDPC